jgi:hypothetical protein
MKDYVGVNAVAKQVKMFDEDRRLSPVAIQDEI